LRCIDKNIEDQLFALVTAQHDGLLNDESNARLAELLSGDENAQLYYLELLTLLNGLGDIFRTGKGSL
jgi:hypothetical protein